LRERIAFALAEVRAFVFREDRDQEYWQIRPGEKRNHAISATLAFARPGEAQFATTAVPAISSPDCGSRESNSSSLTTSASDTPASWAAR